jgi:hypothetical protein
MRAVGFCAIDECVAEKPPLRADMSRRAPRTLPTLAQPSKGHQELARKLLAAIAVRNRDAQRPFGILYIGPGLLTTDDRKPEHPLKCSTSRSGGEMSFSHFGHFTVGAGRALSSRFIAPSIIPAVKSREDHAGRVCNADARQPREYARADSEFGTQTQPRSPSAAPGAPYPRPAVERPSGISQKIIGARCCGA